MQQMFIVRKGHAYFVRPAQIVVAPGDTFSIANLTAQEARVLFPEFSDKALTLSAYEPSKKTSYAEIKVPAEAKVGFSPFAAFVAEGRDFCEGESAPGIIISK